MYYVVSLICIFNLSVALSSSPNSCTVHEDQISSDGSHPYDQHVTVSNYMVCENISFNISILKQDSNKYFKPNKIRMVRYVVFKNSSVAIIPHSMFDRFQNLKAIYLNHSHVSSLEVGAFNELGQLREIHLHHNNLTRIPEAVFDGFPQLALIDLSFNHIHTIDMNAFYDIPKLTALLLSNNQIESINGSSFYDLPNLEYLDLSVNKLRTESDPFVEFFKLSTLLLSNNHIEFLTLEYTNYKFLRTLDLSYNYIKDFDGSLFSEFLQSINISNNLISEVSNISRLVYLRELDVSYNNISSVVSDLIKNMDKLNVLQMQYNNLEEIPIGFFSGCTGITHLNLSHNEIAQMEYGLFSGLNSLTKLDVSYNEIEVLEADTFYSLPELEFLDISFNRIGFLSLYKLGQHCSNLKTINLGGNNFTCASLSSIMRDARIGHFGRRSIDVLHGTFENVTNIHGIPCRNTNNNNLLYKVISSLPDNKNNNTLNDLDYFFNAAFKNSTFYQFFSHNFMSERNKDDDSPQDEKLSDLSDNILSQLSAIQHLLIVLVLLIITFALFQIIKNVLHFRCPRKSSSIEPDFLL